MKIVFLISSMNAGGAERVAATLCNAWAQTGHEITLVPCFSGPSKASFYELDPAVRFCPLAQRLPAGKLASRLLKPQRLRQLILEIKPDVVVSFLTNVNVCALMALRGTTVPLVVCERTNPVRGQKISALLRFLRKRLYPRADAVMLQTEQAAREFAAVMPPLRRMAVIPNPLSDAVACAAHQALEAETAAAEPGSNSHPAVSESAVLLGVGRLVPIKRFDLLIRAFGRIQARHPNWVLHIYGEGPLKDALDAQIKESGLEGRVCLKGASKEIPRIMQGAQAFAMTSALEGFPNVLLEALALGLPAVCMDCPSGPAEMSSGGKLARLVRDGDETAFAQALDELLSNKNLRRELGRAARQSMLERYSLEAVLAQWDQLFKDVLNRDQLC